MAIPLPAFSGSQHQPTPSPGARSLRQQNYWLPREMPSEYGNMRAISLLEEVSVGGMWESRRMRRVRGDTD